MRFLGAVCGVLVARHPISAAVFGVVERLIGGGHQVLRRLPASGAHAGDADRNRDHLAGLKPTRPDALGAKKACSAIYR